jgi:hypothetical protein
MNLRKEILFCLCIVTSCALSAQEQSEKEIKQQVLTTIQTQLETTSSAVDQRVLVLDQRIQTLDNRIATTNSSIEKVTALNERVKVLEDKQKAFEETNLAVYKANYQSAIINLVSMDREIRPLVLFNQSQDFFTALNQTCNPLNYRDYADWFKKYKEFIERKKASSATLNVVSNLINLSEDLTKGNPLSGPITSTLFTSIGEFIGTLGRRNQELIDQSNSMFLLTMKVAQFTNDKDLIESEGEIINKELTELRSLYDEILKRNLGILGISWNQYNANYSSNPDGIQRLRFLNELAAKSSDYIARSHTANEAEWRSKVYQEMQEVQSIKIRFGTATFKIKENILRFGGLFEKYENDVTIGTNVASLSTKLNSLASSFESTFQPLEYIKSATRMYKVM